MSLSTKEVTEKYNISMHTLRYYEKEGLLPKIKRDRNGSRQYSETDLEWLVLIRCMRAAGMSIKYIKHYAQLCEQGASTISERAAIMLMQKEILNQQKQKIDDHLAIIDWKLKCYQEKSAKQKLAAQDQVSAHAKMDAYIQKRNQTLNE
ncbi:MerR family transcriptional regulator [Amphibacillus sediminis]|uniref:MerR family transcriptional regulator n=1 Tax=Amphibacillus sediminis TaxID=360185 RepID=UPI0009F986FA|nr:MerR family transcriptional regulator [Amphibacillus sediminis]